jgi:hypothetical protein
MYNSPGRSEGSTYVWFASAIFVFAGNRFPLMVGYVPDETVYVRVDQWRVLSVETEQETGIILNIPTICCIQNNE